LSPIPFRRGIGDNLSRPKCAEAARAEEGGMAALVLISLAFTALAAWQPRWWTLMVPFAVYLLIAWLGEIGILVGSTSLPTALLAGAMGAVFASLGLVIGRAIRRPSAT
jgi:hypothetical protein